MSIRVKSENPVSSALIAKESLSLSSSTSTALAVLSSLEISNPSSSSTNTDPTASSSLFNSMLSTKECMTNIIDEIETLSKELIVQTINSNKLRINDSGENEMLELTKIIIQKQNQLNNFFKIAAEQIQLHAKITRVKAALVERDTDIKNLLLYLKEAEQVLSSAVYQSRQKLNMIKKAKPLPSELIIRYAHKISAGFGVCCPENWNLDNPIRPYPTDVDMRRGWLAKLGTGSNLGLFDDSATKLATASASAEDERAKLVRSNSKTYLD